MPVNLADQVPNATTVLVEECLQHPFFYGNTWISRPLADPHQLTMDSIGSQPNLELNLWDFNHKKDDCFLGSTLAVNTNVSNIEMIRKTATRRQDLMFCSDYEDEAQHPGSCYDLKPRKGDRRCGC
ncbi:hypothetical protein L1987_19521 [Smallanthus sonchifolius]|uniref:Uncharacterized protein n=1 Tax=Smallanthus sonchifolius TaxID=185202 RepID=A0ACB9INW5_9ASTR|nr:hypothetical protein L1987_19521 [Smallanthus sonchifolius]